MPTFLLPTAFLKALAATVEAAGTGFNSVWSAECLQVLVVPSSPSQVEVLWSQEGVVFLMGGLLGFVS